MHDCFKSYRDFNAHRLGENMKGYWSQNLQFWLRNGLNSPRRKVDFGSLQLIVDGSSSILLCILGELAWGGSVAVAVAVGVSDM